MTKVYPALHYVADLECLYLFNPLLGITHQQVLKIYYPSVETLQSMVNYMSSAEYGLGFQRRIRYDKRLKEDALYSIIVTYIDNISNDAIVRGPTEQTKLFVKMGCIIHRRDFGLAWFIALDQWDKRLSDSGLRLENPDSKELQNIINEGIQL